MSRPQQLVDRTRAMARIDFAPTHAQPATSRVVLATASAIAASLLADALLVKAGTAFFPATKGYAHFRFYDYGTLTVVGVLAAGASWPIFTRISSAPRWLFARLAVLVTLVLWLPDAWLLAKGEPGRAVGVLMTMHLAIALITYNLLVRVAPVGAELSPAGAEIAPVAGVVPPIEADDLGRIDAGDVMSGEVRAPATRRSVWIAMACGVGLEFVIGIVALFAVPLGRPDEWLPSKGEAVYLVHSLLGALLGFAAVALVVRAARSDRLTRIGARIGAGGLLVGMVGGLLAAYHPDRVTGLGLMLVGAMAAGFGYLIPIVG